MKIALVLLAGTAALSLHAGTASAAAAVTAQGALTDNYKASYNADPAAGELRTWLQLRSVRAGGTTYVPAVLPATGQLWRDAATGVALRGSDGGSAVLTARTTSTNTLGQGSFRTESTGQFGLLVQERDRAALAATPIREVFTLTRSGRVVGSFTATYRYDAAIANAPRTSIEWNGPGGRWWVGGTATRLDWESAPPAGPDTTAPVLTDVSIPATTGTRSITVRVAASDAVGVTQLRFANEDGTWSAWRPYAATSSWTLSASPSGYKGVSTQVRDAAGNESGVLYRRTTCTCP